MKLRIGDWRPWDELDPGVRGRLRMGLITGVLLSLFVALTVSAYIIGSHHDAVVAQDGQVAAQRTVKEAKSSLSGASSTAASLADKNAVDKAALAAFQAVCSEPTDVMPAVFVAPCAAASRAAQQTPITLTNAAGATTVIAPPVLFTTVKTVPVVVPSLLRVVVPVTFTSRVPNTTVPVTVQGPEVVQTAEVTVEVTRDRTLSPVTVTLTEPGRTNVQTFTVTPSTVTVTNTPDTATLTATVTENPPTVTEVRTQTSTETQTVHTTDSTTVVVDVPTTVIETATETVTATITETGVTP